GLGQKEDRVSALRIVDRGRQRLCSCSWNAVDVERDLPGQLRPPPPPAYREGGERLGAVGLDLERPICQLFYNIGCFAYDHALPDWLQNSRQPAQPHHNQLLWGQHLYPPEGDY